jgi:hypothetical protein
MVRRLWLTNRYRLRATLCLAQQRCAMGAGGALGRGLRNIACQGVRIAAAPCQSSAGRGGARLRFASRWDENDSRSGRDPFSTSFGPSGGPPYPG